MADRVFDDLLREAEKKNGLTRESSIRLTEDEYEILSKKAERIGVAVGDLLREYILKTSAFEDVFNKKKTSGSKNKTTVSGG